MIGTLGRAVFEASTNRVFTIDGVGRSGSPRIEEHAVIGKKAVLEFIAPGLETFTFSIRLDAALGVNPSAELNRLRASRDAGEILPLVLGGQYLGDWAISDLSEGWSRFDGVGRVIVATASVTLKEVRADGRA